MSVSFECLYFLDNQQLCIVEIKLNNVLSATEKKDHYKWLLINKRTMDVKEMRFNAMDSTAQIEERFFDLGYLKFDAQKGVYISKDPKEQYQLEKANCETVPEMIADAIAAYLDKTASIIFDHLKLYKSTPFQTT
ncbi:hypothetical protein HDC92_003800 [Pedobacter sp. AK017]|uniref:hypothetical protein n=1 Tax=Pedobacter sp. AK017 TaxID=2723073 RepID=UPI00161428B8|nr:hypothetical protein [Pedobacter sp. AK017]MBB5440102.1 hypothetical protein [Pedobacter sp. AK017]